MHSLAQHDLQVFWVTSFGPFASHHQTYIPSRTSLKKSCKTSYV